MRRQGYTKDEAAQLVEGDVVEFYTGLVWVTAEVLEPLRDAGSPKGLTVRVTNGTYATEAAPNELRP
ncbi:hypothetical protein ACFWDN_13065 [Micromonospora chalcea]